MSRDAASIHTTGGAGTGRSDNDAPTADPSEPTASVPTARVGDGDELLRWFGTKLRALRQRSGMTQAGLAKAVRRDGLTWHPTTISKFESGLRTPDLLELATLAKVLGVPLVELVEPVTDLSDPMALARLWSDQADRIDILTRSVEASNHQTNRWLSGQKVDAARLRDAAQSILKLQVDTTLP